MIDLDDPSTPIEPAPEHRSEPAAGEKFISFGLGDKLFCVAALSVQEVVQPIAPAAVPGAPEWLLGLGAHRGEPIALIDPKAVAGHLGTKSDGKSKTIVFRTLPNQTQFALTIDSLNEMITVEPAAFHSGEVVRDGRPVTLVDQKKLFESFEGHPA